MIEQLKTIREALERLSCLGNGSHYGNSDGNRIAQEVLPLARQLESLVGEQEPVAYGMPDTQLGRQHRMMMVRLDKGQDGCTVPLYLAAPVAQQPYEAHLLSLLARIHRDGGHYTAEHGIEKSVVDADLKVAHLFAAQEAQQPQVEAVSDDLRDRLVAISAAIADQDDRAAQAMIREILAAPQQAEAVPETHPDCDCGRAGTHEMHWPGCAHAASKVAAAVREADARYRAHIEREWRKLNLQQAEAVPSDVVRDADVEAAAKKMAEIFDYPWDFMPEKGRNTMRENVRAVLDAAIAQQKGGV